MKFAPVVVVLLAASVVSGQSLADAARAERERRAKLARHAPEVTNDDLKRPKILPAAEEQAPPVAAAPEEFPALTAHHPFAIPTVPLWKLAEQPGFSLGEYARELRRLKAEREALANAPVVNGADGAVAITQPAPQPKPERPRDREEAPVPVRAAEVRESTRKPARVGRASQQREFPRRPQMVPRAAELAKAPPPAAEHREESPVTPAAARPLHTHTVPAPAVIPMPVEAKLTPKPQPPITAKQEQPRVTKPVAPAPRSEARAQAAAAEAVKAPRLEARIAPKPQAPVIAKQEQRRVATAIATAKHEQGPAAQRVASAKKQHRATATNTVATAQQRAPQPRAAQAPKITAPRVEVKLAEKRQTPVVAKEQPPVTKRVVTAKHEQPAAGNTVSRRTAAAPHESTTIAVAKQPQPAAVKAAVAKAARSPQVAPAPVAAPVATARAERTILVSRGDSLWKLAAIHLGRAQRWAELWKANPQLRNPDLIHPGDVLYYSEADAVQATRVSPPSRTRARAAALSAKLGG